MASNSNEAAGLHLPMTGLNVQKFHIEGAFIPGQRLPYATGGSAKTPLILVPRDHDDFCGAFVGQFCSGHCQKVCICGNLETNWTRCLDSRTSQPHSSDCRIFNAGQFRPGEDWIPPLINQIGRLTPTSLWMSYYELDNTCGWTVPILSVTSLIRPGAMPQTIWYAEDSGKNRRQSMSCHGDYYSWLCEARRTALRRQLY